MNVEIWLARTVVGFILAITIVKILSVARKNRYPQCASGKCGVEDYEGVELTSKGLHLVCKCGQHYLLQKQRFQLLDKEGKEHSYKRRTLWRRWVDDSE
jgi:hypothetical protein